MDDKTDLFNMEIDNLNNIKFEPEIGDLVLFIREDNKNNNTIFVGQIKDIIALASYYIVIDSSNALYRVPNVYPITQISAMAQWSTIRPLDS